MLRITALFLVGFLVAPSRGSCQTAGPHAAQPERPTVATHAGTIAEGWLEIEAGGEQDRYSDHSDGCALPVTVKLGVASRLQLSLFASGILPQGGSGVHPGDVALGVKWRLSETLPFHGRFALLPSVKLPTGSPASGAGTGTTDVSLLFISSHELGPIELDINFGFTRRSGDAVDILVWRRSGGPAGLGSGTVRSSGHVRPGWEGSLCGGAHRAYIHHQTMACPRYRRDCAAGRTSTCCPVPGRGLEYRTDLKHTRSSLRGT